MPSGAVTPAGGGSQPLTQHAVTLSTAQIRALNSGVAVTDTPASGFMYVPVQAVFSYVYGSQLFTSGSGSNQHIYLTTIQEYLHESNGGSWMEVFKIGILESFALSVSSLFFPTDDISLAGADGQALALVTNNNYTGGDGHVKVTTWYATISVPT